MTTRPPYGTPPRFGAAAAVCTLLAIAAPASADEVALAPSKDNTIYSESNSRSNGAGMGLFAGRVAPRNGGARRRALVAFDLTAAVPSGATITGARLEMRVTMSISGVKSVAIHRLLADWGEGLSNAVGGEGGGATALMDDATWRFRFFNDMSRQWQTLGGDYVGAASATQSGNMGTFIWVSTAEMVADVQGWVDTPSSNFGWIVIGNEAQTTTAKRFGSSEEPAVASRPRLVIEFEPGTNPTATATVTAAADMPTPTIPPTSTHTPPVLPTTTHSPTIAPTLTRTAVVTHTTTATSLPDTPATATTTPTAMISTTPEATQTPTPTGDQSASPTPAITATPSATPGTETPTASRSPAPTDTPTPVETCPGDCDGNGTVGINELITCVNIALGTAPPSACPACDPSGSGSVEINELVAAVNIALSGCFLPQPL